MKASHRVETEENKVMLISNATGKVCLTVTNPIWNGTGNLLTYMLLNYVGCLRSAHGKQTYGFEINY